MVTALTLLRAFLDLRSLTPDLSHWTVKRQTRNLPRLIRLRRLRAMFRAFGLRWHPPSFVKGGFIRPDEPRYVEVLAKLAAEVRPSNAHGSEVTGGQLTHLFEKLYHYRELLDGALLERSGGVASGLYRLGWERIAVVNRVIRDNLAVIEDVLVVLISPEGAAFSVDVLARDYGYPDVDLDDIDLDWE